MDKPKGKKADALGKHAVMLQDDGRWAVISIADLATEGKPRVYAIFEDLSDALDALRVLDVITPKEEEANGEKDKP